MFIWNGARGEAMLQRKRLGDAKELYYTSYLRHGIIAMTREESKKCTVRKKGEMGLDGSSALQPYAVLTAPQRRQDCSRREATMVSKRKLCRRTRRVQLRLSSLIPFKL